MESKRKVLEDARKLEDQWDAPSAREVLRLLILYIEAESQSLEAALIKAREAMQHVLTDDGYVPRATSSCRKVVAEALTSINSALGEV
jgi:hypothetical protein